MSSAKQSPSDPAPQAQTTARRPRTSGAQKRAEVPLDEMVGLLSRSLRAERSARISTQPHLSISTGESRVQSESSAGEQSPTHQTVSRPGPVEPRGTRDSHGLTPLKSSISALPPPPNLPTINGKPVRAMGLTSFAPPSIGSLELRPVHVAAALFGFACATLGLAAYVLL